MGSVLPPGFKLDPVPAEDPAELPSGFTLDAPGAPSEAAQPTITPADAETSGFSLSSLIPDPTGVVGAIPALVGGIGTQIAAGVAGLSSLIRSPTGGGGIERALAEGGERRAPIPTGLAAAVENIRGVQAAGQELFAPKTPEGQQAVESFAGAVESISQLAKQPLSAVPFLIGGAGERERFLEVPLGDYLGDLAEDSGASPILSTLAFISPELAGIALGTGAVRTGARAAAKPSKPIPPTIDELKDQSRALFELIDKSGTVIAAERFIQGVNKIANKAEKRGVRKKLTPKTSAALKELEKEAKKGDLTLSKAQEMRRVLKQAQSTTDTADLAAATSVVQGFDRFMETLKPADLSGSLGPKEANQYLKSARNLWSRARKTEEIDEMIERAKNRSNFTGSGEENALRTEFRQLAQSKKRMRTFTKDEQTAIRGVARGTTPANAFRAVGRLAPSNVLNSAVGSVVGAGLFGPAGAAIAPVAGAISRTLATKLTKRAVARAREKTLAGPQ